MSAFISLTGPHRFSAEAIGTGDEQHATVWANSNGVTAAVNLTTSAEADELIRAALAAKDLLATPQGSA